MADIAKRVFLIILDSFGIGEAPDAADFGDVGANTLRSISRSDDFCADNLVSLGLGAIDGVEGIDRVDKVNEADSVDEADEIDFVDAVDEIKLTCVRKEDIGSAVARLEERSRGKDTTTGHWELCGLVSKTPLPTYPDGFPDEIIDSFSLRTGRGVLCNKPYSGTAVIRDFGREHIESGKLIVYTSADSVFQIAAHEDIVPVEELYRYCRIARELLTGEHGVGRVIARPFTGSYPDYIRSPKRHDFSLEPPSDTLLDILKREGLDVISVGKIFDIFAGRGITEAYYTRSNAEGMEKTLEMLGKDLHGLCFTNLVDFDMLYGHRNDVDGYARAIAEFDAWLPRFIEKMRDDDVLMISADHGCDPGYLQSTDHSREFVPFIALGKAVKTGNYGTIDGFSCVGATIARLLNVEYNIDGSPVF